MKITKRQLRRLIKEQLSGYDNIEMMNKAVMDAIFDRPLGEDEIISIAQKSAPQADSGEVLDFIDALVDQGTIEYDPNSGMYDLP